MRKGSILGLAAAMTIATIGSAADHKAVSRVASTGSLKYVMLDALDMQQVSFAEALQTLRGALENANPGAPVNFVTMVSEAEAAQLPRVTLKLTNVPMEDALRYICEAAGLRFRVDKHAVVIFTPGREERMKMVTRVFKVVPGAFEEEVVKPANQLSNGGTVTRSTGAGALIKLGQ